MNYRLSQVLAAESITTAGTKVIDINLIDPISRFLIRVDLTANGSTPTGHPALALPKIELIDGSKVLYSATGIGAEAVDLYDMGFKDVTMRDWTDNSWVCALISMNFGRYLYDEEFGFSPTKFLNPQLKITHDYSKGGCTPDAANLRVWADCFDDKKISFAKMLLTKEHYSYAMVSSGVTYIDLPTDYPMRKLIIMSRAADKRAQDQFYQVRLTEEFDKKIVFDEYTEMLEELFAKPYGRYREYICGYTDPTGRNFPITPTAECKGALTSGATASITIWETYKNGGYLKVGITAGGFFDGEVSGYTPHGAVPVLFGKQDNPADWYDVTKLKNLRLKLTAGSSVGSGSTCQVITQQALSY